MKDEKLLIAILPEYDGFNTAYMPIEDSVDWKNVEENIRNCLEDKKQKSVKFIIRTRKWFDNLGELN